MIFWGFIVSFLKIINVEMPGWPEKKLKHLICICSSVALSAKNTSLPERVYPKLAETRPTASQSQFRIYLKAKEAFAETDHFISIAYAILADPNVSV